MASDLEPRQKMLIDLKNRLSYWSKEADIRWCDIRWVLDSLQAETNYQESSEISEFWEE